MQALPVLQLSKSSVKRKSSSFSSSSLNILCWNCQGILNREGLKRYELFELVKQKKIDVLLLNETWLLSSAELVPPAGFRVLTSPPFLTPSANVRRGCALIYSDSVMVKELPDNGNPTLVGARVLGKGKGNDLYLAACYLPPEEAAADKQCIRNWLKRWIPKGAVILAGDFNISSKHNKKFVVDIMAAFKLVDIGKAFGALPTTTRGTRVDLLLASETLGRSFFSSFTVADNESLGSYHKPCIISCVWNSACKPIPVHSKQLGLSKLRLDPLRRSDSKAILSSCATALAEEPNLDARASVVRDSLLAAASVASVEHKAVRIVAGLPYQEELQNLVRLKNALGRKAARLSIAGNLPEASTLLSEKKQLQKLLSAKAHSLKTSCLKTRARQFENKGANVFAYLSSVLDDRKQLPEQITTVDGSLAVGKKSVIQGLADFYRGASTETELVETALQTQVDSVFARRGYQTLSNDGPLGSQPTWKEVFDIVKGLDSKKAPGLDKLSPEHVSFVPVETTNLIHSLLLEVFNTNQIPHDWRVSRVTPVLKKGKDRGLPSSYRPIYVIPVLCKILSTLLLNRLRASADDKGILSDNQRGFRAGSSCQLTALLLREILELRRLNKLSTYLGLLDIQNAFPSIPRDLLFQRLLEKLGDSRVIRLIYNLYREDIAKVGIGQDFSQPWVNTVGVKTGDPLSPLLSIIFFDTLVEALQAGGHGVVVGDTRIPCILLADDIVILGENAESIQAALNCAAQWSRDYRMRFSTDGGKSAVLIYAASSAGKQVSTALPLSADISLGSPAPVHIRSYSILKNRKCGSTKSDIPRVSSLHLLPPPPVLKSTRHLPTQNPTWTLGLDCIAETSSYRYLGWMLGNTPAGVAHFKYLLPTLKKKLGLLKRAGVGGWMGVSTSRNVAQACLASVMDYSSVAWFSSLTLSQRATLDSWWKSVARLVTRSTLRANGAALQALLDLDSLEDRWTRAILMALHAIHSSAPNSLQRIVLAERTVQLHAASRSVKQRGFPIDAANCLESLQLGEYLDVSCALMKKEQWRNLVTRRIKLRRSLRLEQVFRPVEDWVASRALLLVRADALMLRQIVYGASAPLGQFLCQLASSSLPVQACRAPLAYLRKGGAQADQTCKLCAGGRETVSHFITTCKTLAPYRPPDWVDARDTVRKILVHCPTRLALFKMWRERSKLLDLCP